MLFTVELTASVPPPQPQHGFEAAFRKTSLGRTADEESRSCPSPRYWMGTPWNDASAIVGWASTVPAAYNAR